MTHLDEALSDGANATKRDLVDYLEAVADRMRAESSHREVRYALCEDKPTLIWLANQRAVEYNVTLGTAEHLDRPSYLVLDIDPPAAGEFGRAVAAARLVRQALSEAALAGDQDQRGQGRAHLCARSRFGGCELGAALGIRDRGRHELGEHRDALLSVGRKAFVTTSQLPASAALAGSTRTHIVYASHPSAIEAGVWLLAGAFGYVTCLKSLALAVAAVSDGEIWLDPHAAAALYRLIQMANHSRWNSLAAAGRPAAEGMSWGETCSAPGFAQTGVLLSNLRTDSRESILIAPAPCANRFLRQLRQVTPPSLDPPTDFM